MELRLYKNIKTNQGAFNAVAKHLATMTERSVVNDICAYYHEGNRCAIGGIMPIKVAQHLGSISASVLRLKEEVDFLLPPNINEELLNLLQGEHDNRINWSTKGFIAWKELKKLGTYFGLDTSIIDEIIKEKNNV